MTPLTPPKSGLTKSRSFKRQKYWNKHELPTRKLTKLPAMQKRLRAEVMSIISVLADLGARSDVAVLKMRPTDLVHNRAFAEHQQKVAGAIRRFAKRAAWAPMPTKIAAEHNKSAYFSMEYAR